MSLLTPLALLGSALALPIVLLYMLRLRRREVVVSSTFLWAQVLRDREANTPWQRLRRNLLLLLQLLILAALVFALARPYILVPAVSTGQIALLLDASASMNATDSPDGTRFSEAVRRAREIVSTLSAGDTMTILRVGRTTEVLAPYTDDKARLNAALDAAQPGSAGADWASALTIAAAGAPNARTFSAVIISDGGGALREGGLLAIPGDLQVVRVGASDANLAVSALAARTLPGAQPQLFAQVQNTGAADIDAIFTLRVDGELYAAERYTLPARASLPIVVALPDTFETVSATITPPADQAANYPNALPDDDSAYAVAPFSGDRRVLLLGEGNDFLENVLRSLPGVRLTRGTAASAIRGDYDLIVLDGVLADPIPPGDLLVFNPPASSPYWTLGGTLTRDQQPDPLANIRTGDDPRLAYVEVGDLQLRAFRQVTAAWAAPLITAAGGPLLLAGETDGRQIAIFTFDLRDSDLPLQIAFPILMSALLDSFTPTGSIDLSGGSARVGEAIPLRLPAAAGSARVTLPDDTTQPLDPGAAAFTGTARAGLYAVEALAGESVTERTVFAVNLFDPAESAIAPGEVTIGGQAIGEAVEQSIGQQEFWTWLALVALGLLVFEWWMYHRRQRARISGAGSQGGWRPAARRPSVFQRLSGNSVQSRTGIRR